MAEKNVLCPECGKDVKIVQDEEGEWTGRCANPDCRIDVGAVVTRARYAKALKKYQEPEEPPRPKRRINPFDGD